MKFDKALINRTAEIFYQFSAQWGTRWLSHKSISDLWLTEDKRLNIYYMREDYYREGQDFLSLTSGDENILEFLQEFLGEDAPINLEQLIVKNDG